MRSSAPSNSIRKILIAAVGNSPAILTETAWSLAHQDVPWIPDQVVTITTRTGKAASEDLLLRQKGWDRLCKSLSATSDQLAFGSRDSIRVIGDGRNDFEDIRTPDESAVAADFLLGVLRQYTEQPDTEIVASIAGGRKTMSALFFACMSLLGRTQDRVCHVLVDEDFIAKNPSFLFPLNAEELKASGLQLCDIPFVRVRGWYEKEYSGVPPSYMTLVNRFTQIAPSPANYPQVRIDVGSGICHVGTASIRLSPSEFALMLTLARRIKAGRLPHSWYDFEKDLNELVARTDVSPTADWFHQFRDYKQIDVEEFRKWASTARKKMRTAFDRPELADMLIPFMKSKVGDMYPADKINILDVR